MELTLLDQDKQGNKISFVVKGVSQTYVNTLRRFILERTPTMAIETVEFRKNSSILYDEIIAHRLGLLPLTTDLTAYNLPAQCTCHGEGCAKCQTTFTLSAKGPCTVYAAEMKPKDKDIKPVYPKTPLVKLLKGQELEFTATAVLGEGKDHMKWAPAHVHFTYKPIITVNNASPKLAECKGRYPPHIFDEKGKIDKNSFHDPSVIDACEGICDDVLKVEYDQSAFVFYLESWGQLTPKEILTSAVAIWNRDLSQFIELVKKSA